MRNHSLLAMAIAAVGGLSIGCQAGAPPLPAVQSEQASAPTAKKYHLLAVGDLAGSNFTISGSASTERFPAVAFNPNPRSDLSGEPGEWLVTWDEFPAFDAFAQRVDPAGALLGSVIPVSADVSDQIQTAVVANPTDSEWLVGWTDIRSGELDIFGQRILGTGDTTGASFNVTPTTGAQQVPKLAYDSANNRYLAVFEDGDDVSGQLIGADGSLVGTRIALTTASGTDISPRVAFDSANGQYLVTWQNGDFDIIGQRVDDSGTLSGGPIPIAVDPDNHTLPTPVYDSALDHFLVVWQGGAVRARFVEPDGTTPSPAFDVASGGNQPSAAYDPTTGRFLVVWTDFNFDIWAQRVRPDGTLLAGQFPLVVASGTQWYPALANDSVNSQYLAVWWDFAANNIVGQRVTGAAPDSLAPTWPPKARLTVTNLASTSLTLSWPEATDDLAVFRYLVYQNGVQIASLSAETFTYNVTGLAPSTKYTFKVEAIDDAGNVTTNGPTTAKKTRR